MYLIVGLGNPSLKYRHTRHNVGFDAIDVLAKHYGISIRKKEFFAVTGSGRINGEEVLLVKPQTFMNRSGESILAIMKARGLSPNDLVVLVDDIMLESGNIRIRSKGSSGGHNGLKNIISLCGTEEFTRIRIGVGKMPPEADQIKYVLSRPKKDDATKINNAYEKVTKSCELIVAGRISEAMNLFNTKEDGKSKS